MTNFFVSAAILLAVDLAYTTSPPYVRPGGCCIGRNPCEFHNCPNFPDARCRPKQCGTNVKCEPQYYTVSKDLTFDDCNLQVLPPPCPLHLPLTLCKVDPCSVASCPAKPGATCQANYCGGCNAVFYLLGRKLSDYDCTPNPDSCAAYTDCFFPKPCHCPRYKNAKCILQHCAPNTCKYRYFDSKGKRLSNEDCGLCADGSNYNQCIVSPCHRKICPAYPAAKCVVNHCGKACSHKFVDNAGKEVDCSIKCPPGTPVVKCFARPCDVTKCAKYPNAICVDNYCGGCNAIFYHEGKKLDRLECSDPMCEVPQNFRNGYFVPNLKYLIVGQDVKYTCNKGYRRVGSARRRCVVRGGKPKLTGSHPRCQLICPGKSSPLQCFVDPCKVNSCPARPDAECIPDYCTCTATFVVGGDIAIPPGDCDMIGCKAKPCHEHATCIPTDSNGGYKCICKAGYTGDGVICTMNECRHGEIRCADPCKGRTCPAYPRAVCSPIHCGCKFMWIQDGDIGIPSERCHVIDGCRSKPCHDHATCSKLDNNGGYKCTCKSGYIGDGLTCRGECFGQIRCDDPCKGKTCPAYPRAVCNPIHCGCKFMWVQERDMAIPPESCHVIDGCRNRPCHKDAICTTLDKKGGYKCVCKPGYSGDGFGCQPLCKNGLPPIRCVVNPCKFAKCPAYQHAKCVADMCSCTSKFFLGDIILSTAHCKKKVDRGCPRTYSLLQKCSYCKGDYDCPIGQICCPNRCGKSCVYVRKGYF